MNIQELTLREKLLKEKQQLEVRLKRVVTALETLERCPELAGMTDDE